MKKFEILPSGEDQARILVQASTRAGLLTGAVQGMFVAAEPDVNPDSDDKIERPFSIMGEDAVDLLVELLASALVESAKHGEAFDDVKFTLVTDKKAEGAFIGKPCKKYGKKLSAAKRQGLAMEKNEEGEWESTIAFS